MDAKGSFHMCLACGVEQGLEVGHSWRWWTWAGAGASGWRAENQVGFPGWVPVPDGCLLVAGLEVRQGDVEEAMRKVGGVRGTRQCPACGCMAWKGLLFEWKCHGCLFEWDEALGDMLLEYRSGGRSMLRAGFPWYGTVPEGCLGVFGEVEP
jgi:hypothetical protein